MQLDVVGPDGRPVGGEPVASADGVAARRSGRDQEAGLEVRAQGPVVQQRHLQRAAAGPLLHREVVADRPRRTGAGLLGRVVPSVGGVGRSSGWRSLSCGSYAVVSGRVGAVDARPLKSNAEVRSPQTARRQGVMLRLVHPERASP